MRWHSSISTAIGYAVYLSSVIYYNIRQENNEALSSKSSETTKTFGSGKKKTSNLSCK